MLMEVLEHVMKSLRFPGCNTKMHDILLDNQLTSLQQFFSSDRFFPVNMNLVLSGWETKEDVYIARLSGFDGRQLDILHFWAWNGYAVKFRTK